MVIAKLVNLLQSPLRRLAVGRVRHVGEPIG